MNKCISLRVIPIFLIASVIILSMSVFDAVFSPVKAQTVIATTAYVNVEPNPVEAHQMVNVSMRIEPPPPSPTDRFTGLVVHIKLPDNGTEHIGPYTTDTNGSASINYTPQQVGTYTLQMNYTGKSFAEGTIFYESATSAITTLDVTAAIPTPTPEPTPTPSTSPTPSPTTTPLPTPTLTPIPTATPLASPTASPSPTPDHQSEPFPTTLSVTSVVIMYVVGLGLLVYFRKRGREAA